MGVQLPLNECLGVSGLFFFQGSRILSDNVLPL